MTLSDSTFKKGDLVDVFTDDGCRKIGIVEEICSRDNAPSYIVNTHDGLSVTVDKHAISHHETPADVPTNVEQFQNASNHATKEEP